MSDYNDWLTFWKGMLNHTTINNTLKDMAWEKFQEEVDDFKMALSLKGEYAYKQSGGRFSEKRKKLAPYSDTSVRVYKKPEGPIRIKHTGRFNASIRARLEADGMTIPRDNYITSHPFRETIQYVYKKSKIKGGEEEFFDANKYFNKRIFRLSITETAFIHNLFGLPR